MSKPVIGIDLGTTFSCVSVWKNDTMDTIPNKLGIRTTPSQVAFGDKDIMVGETAKAAAIKNPENCVFDVKRIIGQSFSSESIQRYRKHWPFEIVEGENDCPMIKVTYKGKPELFSAQQISAFILSELKSAAEAVLDTKVEDAVITVPAYFNDGQRSATKAAGEIAGLNVRRIINEPTAAAMAYGLDKKHREKECTVLVYDLGGGTFDVSLLKLRKAAFEVLATDGDPHLGGQDFDNLLVDMCIAEVKSKYGVDISGVSKARAKLKQACEKAKIQLSSTVEASIDVDSLASGVDFEYTLSRAKFDETVDDLVQKTGPLITSVLKMANINKMDVDEIVMVGGSTRIPKVQQLVSDYFDGKKLKATVNPDEVVANGAAAQGAILGGVESPSLNEIVLLDVTSHSLGVAVKGGRMSHVIKKNSSIPCSRKRQYTTVYDNQPSVNILVFEGEHDLTEDNNLLGAFTLDGLNVGPKGSHTVEVMFDIDENSILNVTAHDLQTGTKQNVKIETRKGNFTDEDIMAQKKSFANLTAVTSIDAARKEAVNRLQSACADFRKRGTDAKSLPTKQKESLEDCLKAATEWLSKNTGTTVSQIEMKQKDVEEKCRSILDF